MAFSLIQFHLKMILYKFSMFFFSHTHLRLKMRANCNISTKYIGSRSQKLRYFIGFAYLCSMLKLFALKYRTIELHKSDRLNEHQLNVPLPMCANKCIDSTLPSIQPSTPSIFYNHMCTRLERGIFKADDVHQISILNTLR